MIWQCLNSRFPVTGKGRIICRAGHELPEIANAESVQLGEALGKHDCRICVGCTDFDCMGEPIYWKHRGWK